VIYLPKWVHFDPLRPRRHRRLRHVSVDWLNETEWSTLIKGSRRRAFGFLCVECVQLTAVGILPVIKESDRP
jgi:hypothetical protein